MGQRTAVWGGRGRRMAVAVASMRTGRETKGAVGEFYYLSLLEKLFSKKILTYKLFSLQTFIGGSGYGRRQQQGCRRGGRGGPRPSSRGSWGAPPVVVRAVGAPAGQHFGRLKAKLPSFWSSGAPPVVDRWWGPQSSSRGPSVAASVFFFHFVCQKNN